MPRVTLGAVKSYFMRELWKSVVLLNFHVMPPKFMLLGWTWGMSTKFCCCFLLRKRNTNYISMFKCFFSSLSWVLVELKCIGVPNKIHSGINSSLLNGLCSEWNRINSPRGEIILWAAITAARVIYNPRGQMNLCQGLEVSHPCSAESVLGYPTLLTHTYVIGSP